MYILEIKLDESLSNDIQLYYQALSQQETTDSGVDLVCPDKLDVHQFGISTINFKIKCQMKNTETGDYYPYYLYPRSSISKTPLIMANSVGIIDKDYRGDIMAKVRNIPTQPYTFESSTDNDEYIIKKGSRLFQICAPDLSPIKITIVNELSETSRGEGGFGSTGVSI